MKETFDRLVSQRRDEFGDKVALDRRMPVRWNSDLTCLDAHLHFRPVIEQLTAVTSNKLKAYRLTDTQWDWAEKLQECLQVSGILCYKHMSDVSVFVDF